MACLAHRLRVEQCVSVTECTIKIFIVIVFFNTQEGFTDYALLNSTMNSYAAVYWLLLYTNIEANHTKVAEIWVKGKPNLSLFLFKH